MTIEEIFWHCSDSTFGDVDLIRSWHLARGWSDIGYQFVITNAHPASSRSSMSSWDGLIHPGRDLDGDGDVEDEVGAHAFGHNRKSLALCLIGKKVFTPKQIGSAMGLTLSLMKKYKVPIEKVLGHYEVDDRKTCPNLDMDLIRKQLTETEHAIKVIQRYPLGLFFMEEN